MFKKGDDAIPNTLFLQVRVSRFPVIHAAEVVATITSSNA
jgi:hypothetical protein